VRLRFDRDSLRDAGVREGLLRILEAAFDSIDPERLIRSAVRVDADALCVCEERLPLQGGHVLVIAIGKAAAPMAREAERQLGSALTGGLVIVPFGFGGPTERLRVLEAGHPIPDEDGGRAAAAVEALARTASRGDIVLCLVSGGGSALLAAPSAGLSMEDLAATTGALLRSGAPIDDVNTVRRHLSRLQGGGLARALRGARLRTLILCDVVGSRPESIGSGPTVPDPTTFADAARILRDTGLWESVPDAVRTHIRRGVRGDIPETLKEADGESGVGRMRLLADNETFVEAIEVAAAASGSTLLRIEEAIVGDARTSGRRLGRRLADLAGRASEAMVVFGGGETTVAVRGVGKGGRNQEQALACAVEISGLRGVTAAFFATDGVDGPTDAAGAIVDGRTVPILRDHGLDPVRALDENDAYPCLETSGDLLRTGPTRTNVADAFVAWVEPTRE
jgi:glycerate 2-kinase